METRVFDAIDSIIAILKAAGANTIDGPVPSGDSLDFVFIGYDGDPDGDWRAADIDQDWAGIGNTKKRDETFDVIGAVVSTYSGDSVKASRDRVKAQFALVGTAIRADPSIGLTTAEWAVAGVHPVQLFNDVGQCRLTFVIRVKTRV
jgi:hypothetical protein